MAVAFDAAGPSSAGTNFTTSPGTWTHVNGGNGILVGVTTFTGSSNVVTGVTYGGVTVPLLGFIPSGNVTSGGVALYGLVGGTCPTGSNTVSVTTSDSNSHNAGSVSVTGAGSLGSVVTAFANAAGVSAAFGSTTSGGLLVSAACQGSGNTFAATSPNVKQLEKLTSPNTAADNLAMGTDPSTGSAVSPAYTIIGSDFWGIVAVEVLPAAGGGGVPVTAQPGQTWLRRFHHRQQLLQPGIPPAAVAAVPAPVQRPSITSRPARRARLGPRGACAAGVAVVLAAPAAVPAGITRPPVPVARTAPSRARVGPQGRNGAGLASAIVTPRGTPARPQPFVFRSPPPRRARTGRAGQPGAGIASAIITPLGSPPQPAWRQPIPRRVPDRAQAGPAGRNAAGTASQTVTPRGTPGPSWRPQPRRPAPARGLWRTIAGPQPAAITTVTAYQHAPPPPRSRPPRRALWHGTAAPAFPVLVNTFEGGSNGVTVSPANSGALSGAAFDAVTIGGGATLAFDTTRAMHGALSAQVATVASAASYVQWSASMGPQSPAWFRAYLYFTANPGTNHRVVTFLQGGTLCGYVQLLTTGKLQFVNAAGSAIFTTTAAVPLGQWFRIEGFLAGDATAGQVELKLFTSQPDGVTPDETDTSSAAQNTAGRPDTVRYGVAAAVAGAGPFWMDDLGLSATGYLGPSGAATLGTPGPSWRAQPRRPARARALWRGLAVPALRSSPGPAWRPLPRSAAPRRALWHGGAGPQPVTATAAPPRQPRQPRPAPPRRAVWHGLASRIVTPLGIPSRKPPPPANTPRKRQRGLWRRGAGPQPPPPSGLLAGVTAGPPASRWQAGLPASRWTARPAASRWQAGQPAARYDAGNPAPRWAAGLPLQGRYSVRVVTGSIEYIPFPVSGPPGVDVTTLPLEVAIVTEAHGEPPPGDPAWTAGLWLNGMAAALVDETALGNGDYVVFGRLTATPEKPVVRAGRVRLGPAS